MSHFLGIARECVYSPGKVDADRAILDEVARGLRARHRVRVVSADDPLPRATPGTTVFAMCQGQSALGALWEWQKAGIRVINSPAAIENCHRRRMLAAFATNRIRHPESMLLYTDRPGGLPAWVEAGAWLKRGDVHATQHGDVVRVSGRTQAEQAMAQLRERGIGAALVQRHTDGEVLKFYAVLGGFFASFTPAGATLDLEAAERRALVELAERGARALGLEVFGGDCVRDRSGELMLIDLNDWPSYAPCRGVAADAIAAYLNAQSELSRS